MLIAAIHFPTGDCDEDESSSDRRHKNNDDWDFGRIILGLIAIISLIIVIIYIIQRVFEDQCVSVCENKKAEIVETK